MTAAPHRSVDDTQTPDRVACEAVPVMARVLSLPSLWRRRDGLIGQQGNLNF